MLCEIKEGFFAGFSYYNIEENRGLPGLILFEG